MATIQGTAPIQISLVATPEVDASALAGLHGIFNAFAQMVSDNVVFQAQVVAPDHLFDDADKDTIIRNVMGFSLPLAKRLSQVEHCDILIIPSLYLLQAEWPANPYPQLNDWIQTMHNRGSLICSACTGAFLLAETGLLDDQPATQHWAFAQLFRRCFPRVKLDINQVLVRSGRHGNIIMTGASAAWHDLVVYLLCRFAGPQAAALISKYFLLSIHSDGQAPYVMFQGNTDHNDSLILQVQHWLQQHYQQPAPLEQAIQRSGLQPRSFHRRFKQATGLTPIHYVQMLRIEQAKGLLEQDALSVEQISWQVGYEDPAFFRRLFRRITHMSPKDYRRKFSMLSVGD
jgi:transcriptional regulator GlxA family with amidase domain